ncbi:MAG TPA: prepilin-type N-terminal cleavage/methylation domain-containing protein [Planctomycetota bacterium]|nr:prepilin-type N-terminal cleavage/methylation domain-containing protein [Planctomycetota bacterium]
MPAPRRRALRGKAGFSLIEILVVITIIGLLMTLAFGPVQNALEAGRVTKCMANLRGIGQSFGIYRNQRNKGRWPEESGMRFLLTLVKHKQLTGKDTEAFLCPGTADRNDTGPSGEDGSSYDDWENLDPATISYAGRDQVGSPIRGGDESQIIIASDDNQFGPNHRTITNYLYADGSVKSFDLAIDGAEILEEFPEYEQQGLPIGPDCPFEPLRVLRVD